MEAAGTMGVGVGNIAACEGLIAFGLACAAFVALMLPSAWNFGIFLASLPFRKGKADGITAESLATKASASPLSFAVIVCAHNEEAAIARCVQSVLAQDYPRFTCYVVADNCSDGTARAAREAGAVVLERASKGPSSKGQALAWGIGQICSSQAFDAFAIFDADNVVEPGFLSEAHRGLACGYDAVSGQRETSNAGESLVSALYAAYWGMTVMQSAPHASFGLNALAAGTGFAFRRGALPDGWQAFSMTEDSEMCLHMGMAGKRIGYCANARCREPQTTRLRTMMHQQRRWQTGNVQLVRAYFAPALRALALRPSRRTWDMLMLVVQLLAPLGTFVSLAGFALAAILAAGASAIGAAGGLGAMLCLCALAVVWVCAFCVGAFAVATAPERSRYSLPAALCYPFFLATMGAIELFSCFRPSLRW